MEGVLSFSFEKFKENSKEFREKAPELIEEYMQRICKEYGFTALSWSLHFDEGFKGDSKKLNIHAHIQMINFDFDTQKARFRDYQQKYVKDRKRPNQHFVKMQDIADDVFSKSLGFVRGVSKDKTNKKHLKKEDFVTQKLKEREEKAARLEQEIIEKEEQINNLDLQKSLKEIELLRVQENIREEEQRLSALKRSISTLIDRFKGKLEVFVKNVQKGRFSSFNDDVENVQSVIDDTAKQNQQLSDDMTENSNKVADALKAGKPFKNKKNRPTK